MTTPANTKAEILADLWLNFRDDEEFKDFVEYNDLGLPLSYALTANIVKPTNLTEQFVNETFDLLLAALEISDDTGFETLDQMLGYLDSDE